MVVHAVPGARSAHVGPAPGNHEALASNLEVLEDPLRLETNHCDHMQHPPGSAAAAGVRPHGVYRRADTDTSPLRTGNGSHRGARSPVTATITCSSRPTL